MTHSLVFLLLLVSGLVSTQAVETDSPSGKISFAIGVRAVDDSEACPVYSLCFRGRTLIELSRLGLETEDETCFVDGFAITGVTRTQNNSTWKPVYGERKSVRDRYNQCVVELERKDEQHRRLIVTIRAYDEGVAFCYTIPVQKGLEQISITRENTEFRFTDNHTTWAAYNAQDDYEETQLSRLEKGCERPLTFRIADDIYVALAEARLVDFARMKLSPCVGVPNALVSDLSSTVEADLPLTTPWRVIMVGESPGELLENNDLFLNLNAPCAIDDTSWIKPGKVIREVTLTTEGGKACADFAHRRNLQYVEFDAGWYGHEYDRSSDASAVSVDPKRSPGPLDLKEVIDYAEGKGIGIILYVNRLALERQLDSILPLYQEWGVKGLKYGFVQVGGQKWTAWLHHAVRRAAAHRLMVDVHDEYRPTGYSRTFPNLMTQEGIRGDEARPSSRVTLTILFTRMLAGAGDNTICYYDRRVGEIASHAFQLAKAVCVYSPWQFVYWYDRPPESPQNIGGAGGKHPVIGDEPELEFFDRVPTVWDDTRVIDGEIGEHAVIARRSGSEWFVGAMNGETARTLKIPLDFLDEGKRYTAHIYSDDETIPTSTHVKIERRQVTATTTLSAELAPSSGLAARLVPAD